MYFRNIETDAKAKAEHNANQKAAAEARRDAFREWNKKNKPKKQEKA